MAKFRDKPDWNPDDSFVSPAWHADVLKERKRLIQEGKGEFLDLDEAMTRVREEIRKEGKAARHSAGET
jgi:endo-alpha-1,4-polygalactosaminidase (GH114 family)